MAEAPNARSLIELRLIDGPNPIFRAASGEGDARPVGILRRGVGVGDDVVSVVTNLSADHLGVDGIDTLDQLAEVKAVILRSGVRSQGNALGHEVSSQRLCCDPATARWAEVEWSFGV